jgi:hypothetical protein
MQMNMFEDNSEVGLLRQEIRACKESSEKVRRGVYSKLDACLKLICALQDEVSSLRKTSQGESESLREIGFPERIAI